MNEDRGYSEAANQATAALGAKDNVQEQAGADMAEGKATMPNPIVEALNTLATFIAAQEEKGTDVAAMKQALVGFMNTMKGEGEAPEKEEPEGAPEQPEVPVAPPSPGEQFSKNRKQPKIM